MFSTTQMLGMDLGFPDVCKLPTLVPVPFPNIALPPMAVGAAYNILNVCAPAHTLATTIPITMGDQPGLLGGVVSQTDMASSRRLTAAFTILLDGMPATRLTSMGIQNTVNCTGVSLVPSQLTVLYLAP
ncbi:hypothetical protein A7982_13716 [Minicystis rosea]|nr:hypothetical protein A7982_13716 [Minicystis rosea]